VGGVAGFGLADDDGGEFRVLDQDHEVDLAFHRARDRLGTDEIGHPRTREAFATCCVEDRQRCHHRDRLTEVGLVQCGHHFHGPGGGTLRAVGDVGAEWDAG